MDPRTIIASVGAASKILSSVSTKLLKFIQDTKEVEKTAEALFPEIVSLQGSIDAIDSALQQPLIQAIIRDDRENRLWKSMNDSLLNCRKTLESFEKLMPGFEVKKNQNPFKKAVNQKEIDWKSEEAITLHEQIRSHGLAMQLALQVINVYVSSKGPKTVIGSLSMKTDVLINMIAALEMNWSPQGNNQTQRAGASKTSQAEEKLREFASTVASSVSTIAASRSIPGASDVRDSTGADLTREVSVKSDSGNGIGERNRRNVSNATPSPSQPRAETAVAREQRETFEDSSVPITIEVVRKLVDTAKEALKEAERHYDAYKVAKAKFLEDELKTVKQGKNCDDSMPRKHYVSRGGEEWRLYRWEDKEFQENLAKAERGFEQASKEGKKTDGQSYNPNYTIEFGLAHIYKLQQCWDAHDSILSSLLNSGNAVSVRACHRLAEGYLCRNMLNQANEYCRRALADMRRDSYSSHDTYRMIVKLAVEICKARGETELAEAYEAQLSPRKTLNGAGRSRFFFYLLGTTSP